MYYQSIILETKTEEFENILNQIYKEKVIEESDNYIKYIFDYPDKKNLGVNEVKEISELNSTKSQEVKIILITAAERLTPQAQNSLLKVVEEPSENILIIFQTVNSYKLLDTIRSRCRKIINREILNDNLKDISDFLEMNYLERVSFFDKKLQEENSRVYIESFINKFFLYLADNIDSQEQSEGIGNVVELLEKSYLANLQNVNAKLIVDFINTNLLSFKL